MTGQEEGHLDISRMHVQVLRSTFCLMILAVTILVIFSSVALLRNPKHSPMVNVMVDMAPGTGDQSARMRRGTQDKTSHAHAPVRRDILFKGGPLPGKNKILKKNKHIHSIHGNETKTWSQTKHKLETGNHSKQRLDKFGNYPKHRIDRTGNSTKHRLYMYGNHSKHKLEKFGNHSKHGLEKFGNHSKHRLEKFGNHTKHRTGKEKHSQSNSAETSPNILKHDHNENIIKREDENTKSGIETRTDRTRNVHYMEALQKKDKNKNASNSVHL